MLEILIAANNVVNSPIILKGERQGSINTLPEKLRARVLEVANKLNEKGYWKAEYYHQENSKPYFGFYERRNIHDKNHIGDDSEFETIADTMILLRWYLGPHLYGEPGVLGGPIRCRDCGLTQRRGKPFAEYCEFIGCPSHAKWAEIIEGYEPPKYLNDGALAQTVQKLQSNKQAPTSPAFGDEANKWIQKG